MRSTAMNAPAARDAPPPWYRQPWPWLLMAGPAIVVVAGFATLWLAARPTTASSPTTITSAGLLINRELERTDRGARWVSAPSSRSPPMARVRVSLGRQDPGRRRRC